MTSTAVEKFARASSEMARLEARLGFLRSDRAAAVEAMRAEGMTWADIEKATGLTRQRLWKITRP